MPEGDKYFVAGASKADDLALHLLTFPAEIKRQEIKILDLTEKYELAVADVKEQDARFMANINANPAFKNDGQRKTELEAMRNASGEYSDAIIEKKTSCENLAIAGIDLIFVQNMFKAYLAIIGGNKQ